MMLTRKKVDNETAAEYVLTMLIRREVMNLRPNDLSSNANYP